MSDMSGSRGSAFAGRLVAGVTRARTSLAGHGVLA
jgi:hypothetical protein